MPLKPIAPLSARQFHENGAMLVDIRSADEHARERIAGACHIPLERLTSRVLPFDGARAVIFHCRSGNRTQANAQALAACVTGDGYVLTGGLEGWKNAGLPVEADPSQPLELQRQVQLAAGAMVVLGAVLGATLSPWFHLLSGAVGGGLMFAGVSGTCGLARVLMKMPWNRGALTRHGDPG